MVSLKGKAGHFIITVLLCVLHIYDIYDWFSFCETPFHITLK